MVGHREDDVGLRYKKEVVELPWNEHSWVVPRVN